mmetsp:Transcript_15898/g.50695  ORF Transcript_15898/g.50695 Transcript_15898/m.50695 type:complete len:126 (-) Transcript_15898:48-425(-)
MVQCVSNACAPCAALSVCAIVIGILDEFRGRLQNAGAWGGRPSGERSSSLGSKGGGDTPRNMTDWRRSLSMARSNRQDDNDGLRAPVAHVSPGCDGSGSNSAASQAVVGDCSNGAGSVRKAQPWR